MSVVAASVPGRERPAARRPQRLAPLTTKSTSRPSQAVQRRRLAQSITVVSAPDLFGDSGLGPLAASAPPEGHRRALALASFAPHNSAMTPDQTDADKAILAARAISVVKRVVMMCDFIEHPAIKTAVEQAVPVSMPPLPGALGFDIPLWVGLGMVGLWAALDGFADRASLKRLRCSTCGRACIPTRFACYTQDDEEQSLKELEDLRHLYAHNYAGEADDKYFNYGRHVLNCGIATKLTCGAQFDGRRASLGLPHLRTYSRTVQSVLERLTLR